MTTTINSTRLIVRRVLTASVAMGLAAGIASVPMSGVTGIGGAAYAQSTPGVSGAGKDKSAPGSSGSGHSGVSGAGKGESTKGAGGAESTKSSETTTDSDKKGPKFGGGDNAQKPGSESQGGRPVWAKEGIPVVELGRLSVARAPSHVITKAEVEAVANWVATGATVMTLTADGQPTLTMTVAQFYSLPAEQFATIAMTYYKSITRIDSPLENLGLLQVLGTTGVSPLAGVTPASAIDLAAIFLASASDKTLTISTDTVIAINTLLGLPSMTSTQVTSLATKAEAVRLAILIGHES